MQKDSAVEDHPSSAAEENLINDVISVMIEPSRKNTLRGPEKDLIEQMLATLEHSPGDANTLSTGYTLEKKPAPKGDSSPVLFPRNPSNAPAARLSTLQRHYRLVLVPGDRGWGGGAFWYLHAHIRHCVSLIDVACLHPCDNTHTSWPQASARVIGGKILSELD